MNINNLQKHYDKLTARERFALTIAASMRDDDADRRALLDTAPKVNFEFPQTKGLHEGFRDLVHIYIMQQLGRAATLFMLIGFDDDGHTFKPTAHGAPVTLEDAIELCARQFMEGLEAFAVICKEYNVDPAIISKYCTYEHVLHFAELTTRAYFYDDYSTALLTDLESAIADYRNVIETARTDWAETQAK